MVLNYKNLAEEPRYLSRKLLSDRVRILTTTPDAITQPEISIPTGPSGVCSAAPPLVAALVPPRKACSHVSRSSVRYPRTSSIGPGALLTLAVIRRSVQYS